MPIQYPSIQSFFAPTQQPPPTASPSHPRPSKTEPDDAAQGDGFTITELSHPSNPSTSAISRDDWFPRHEYEHCDIGSIAIGPGSRTFTGRVVNFFDNASNGGNWAGAGNGGTKISRRAAKGCVKMVVKDDTGAITVRLWYAKAAPDVRLGQLCSVWTTHVSNGEHGKLALPCASTFTSIFPERDRNCHFTLYDFREEKDVCRRPLGYRSGRAIPDLFTLQQFINGGHEVASAKVVVVVKFVAARKIVQSKKGENRTLVNVGVFDHTAEASISLWGATSLSAADWKSSETILMLANPGSLISGKKLTLKLTASTIVDVDPAIEDAVWLKDFATRLTRREHVNPPFPEGGFDFDAAIASEIRVLYTLADLDGFARVGATEGARFIGYLSMVILELNLVVYHRRHMLMSNECCGLAIYANALTATCKQCERRVDLRINPRVLGLLADETGSIVVGKLVVACEAWEKLFGTSRADFVATSYEDMRLLEQRLLCQRVTLLFGWGVDDTGGQSGRICVKDMQVDA